ncbi:MAG TPA: hypothetical protein VEJ44_06730, partial [Acidimicrobiales bacterium]|nr:hypothetical protein [Acidimicrobiales bacterium]
MAAERQPRSRASRPDGSGRQGAFRLPFAVLQVAELVVALVLVDVATHIARGSLLLITAGALALLALTAKGPLGLVRVCPRRLHVVLSVVLSGLALVAMVVPRL